MPTTTQLPPPTDTDLEQAVWPEQAPRNIWAPFQNRVWLTGFVLLLLSTVGFVVMAPNTTSFDFLDTAFVFSYLSTVGYLIVLVASKRLRWLFFARPEHYDTYFLYLGLWLVSCFALNRSLPVFNESCTWLSVAVCISVALSVLYAWKDPMPIRWRSAWYGGLAATLVLWLYYSIYLVPFTALGALVVWFFGLSFHAFIPLILSITLIRTLRLAWRERAHQFAIVAGLTLPLAITAGFVNQWYQRDAEIRSAFATAGTEAGSGLPRWVLASQRLSRTTMGENWLKTKVLFEEGRFRSWDNFGGGKEERVHDPLIWIATTLFPQPEIAPDERAQILRSFFDRRHDLEERLWRGNDLRTRDIQTRIQLEPAHRLAYVEKTLRIQNTLKTNVAATPQEALYSFYLPEGAAVTSLSLWVNGVEQPARLSARSRADSAYRTVVGIERRDPSLVHWQEGNTVTLRVFPCTPQEDRQFKIGVTTPLREEGETLVFDNLTFRGPGADQATEQLTLLSNGAQWAEAPANWLKTKGNNEWTGQHAYDPTFVLRLKKPSVAPETFVFNGKQVRISAWQPTVESFVPTAIYLDVNAAWSKAEVKKVQELAGGRPVKIWYEGRWVDYDRERGFELRRRQFSLFPFHLVPDPAHALVVSQSPPGLTPTLQDLQDSEFAKAARARYAQSGQSLRVWHVGSDLTPYLRSLREFRLLQLHTGDWTTLEGLLRAGQFYQNPEPEGTVVIPNSGLRLTLGAADSTTQATTSDDHLLRLFAYNEVLRRIGHHYFEPRYEPADLVRQAEEAFVVTPLSSLVVLESEADYQRFGIHRNKDTLGNAAFKGKGAVPEPGEWALVWTVMVVLGVGWWWRTRHPS